MNTVTDIVISQNTFISLHTQLHNQLRHLILSGRWPNGSQIPSESQFVEHLKVSRSTIRLALQQAELEGLIERAAGRGTFVAYRPSAERSRRLIAFTTYGFDSESQFMLLRGAESAARARDYQIILSYVESEQDEIDNLRRWREENVAGILLWPSARAVTAQQTALSGLNTPIVLMDRTIDGLDLDCVTSDNYGGASAMMKHLLGLGHERIVFLTHHESPLLTVRERYRAYRDCMISAGLQPVPAWQIGKPGHEIGYYSKAFHQSVDHNSPELRQIKDYWQADNSKPTAIFGMNDYMTSLAARAMKLLNMRVPEDVSLAGFDDVDLAAHLEVPLTTVAQDQLTIGKRAAQLLIDRLEGYAGPTNCEYIPTELRVRHSTAVPVRV